MARFKTLFFMLFLIFQLVVLALLTWQVFQLKEQSLLLPAKIDLLISLGDKEINLECPKCPECKDYSKDFNKLHKTLKSNNAPQGYYYFYGGGCR